MRPLFLTLALAVTALTAPLRAQELTPAAVAADKKLWPREVTVLVAHKIALGGGSISVPAGRAYPVKNVTEKDVTIDAMGAEMSFPLAQTDVIARAEAVRKQPVAAAVATPPPAPKVDPAPPLAPLENSASASPLATKNTFVKSFKDNLVARDNGRISPYDGAPLTTKKYIAVYFSASWCGPCRAFTPKLVDWYRSHSADKDKFDIVFFSMDKTEADMAGYMKEDDMRWPALNFANVKGSSLRKLCGSGIPCLVVVDEQGKVVADTFQGEKYMGPSTALKAFEKILADSKLVTANP